MPGDIPTEAILTLSALLLCYLLLLLLLLLLFLICTVTSGIFLIILVEDHLGKVDAEYWLPFTFFEEHALIYLKHLGESVVGSGDEDRRRFPNQITLVIRKL